MQHPYISKVKRELKTKMVWWKMLLRCPGEFAGLVNLEPWVYYPMQEHERPWAGIRLDDPIMLEPRKAVASDKGQANKNLPTNMWRQPGA